MTASSKFTKTLVGLPIGIFSTAISIRSYVFSHFFWYRSVYAGRFISVNRCLESEKLNEKFGANFKVSISKP